MVGAFSCGLLALYDSLSLSVSVCVYVCVYIAHTSSPRLGGLDRRHCLHRQEEQAEGNRVDELCGRNAEGVRSECVCFPRRNEVKGWEAAAI